MSIGFNVGQIWNIKEATERTRILREVVDIGATHVRIGFPWFEIEPKKGKYDWSKTRLLVDEIHAVGLVPLVAMGVWPAARFGGVWLLGGSRATPSDYGNMAGDFVRNFPDVTEVEVCNEPNLASHWADPPFMLTNKPNPTVYAQHVIAAFDAITRVRPDVRVIAGGLAALVTGKLAGNIDPVDFVDGMYRAGIKGKFHALSFHPYPIDGKWNPQPAADNQMMMVKNDQIRELMLRNGDDKPMVWTEYGGSTGNRSEESQKQVLVKGVELSRARPWVTDVYLYTITDIPSMKSDKEKFYGIVRPDGTRKLAYQPVKALLAAKA